jgi:hypothetical protein
MYLSTKRGDNLVTASRGVCVSRFLGFSFALLLSLCGLSAPSAQPLFIPTAVKVTGDVYAFVGPLGQRSDANAGLNANYGFIATATGVILIDSGGSLHSAATLEKAVKEVTPKPIRWVLNTGS